MINTVNIPPFKRFCMTVGNLPSSFMESMTYYEALCWLYDYFEKTLLPAINTTSEAVTELQQAFTLLKTYVDNYFDNLDVQEEINNKLDDMAEKGQLTDIIAQYLGLAGVLAFNTVLDMVYAENITNGSICKTLGKSTYNDGEGRYYKIRTVTTSDEIDGINIIALDVSDTLIAELIPEDYLTDISNLKQDVINIQQDIENLESLTPIACIIRPTAEGWTLIDDTDHEPLNVQGVDIVSNRLTLYHDNDASKVITFEITPDETFAKYGITCGASVGLDDTRIDIYQNLTCTAYIRYQNSEFVLNNDYSHLCSGVEWDDTNKCLIVTFTTNITEPTSWNTVHSYQASTLSSQLQRNIVTMYADTRVLHIYLYDDSGVKITNKGAFDRLICTYSINKKLDPAELVSHPLADSNFWVYGLLKTE